MNRDEIIEALKTLPEDEPFFLLRGSAPDALGADLVRLFVRRAKMAKRDAAVISGASRAADDMERYRISLEKKKKDSPPAQPESIPESTELQEDSPPEEVRKDPIPLEDAKEPGEAGSAD